MINAKDCFKCAGRGVVLVYQGLMSTNAQPVDEDGRIVPKLSLLLILENCTDFENE